MRQEMFILPWDVGDGYRREKPGAWPPKEGAAAWEYPLL